MVEKKKVLRERILDFPQLRLSKKRKTPMFILDCNNNEWNNANSDYSTFLKVSAMDSDNRNFNLLLLSKTHPVSELGNRDSSEIAGRQVKFLPI